MCVYVYMNMHTHTFVRKIQTYVNLGDFNCISVNCLFICFNNFSFQLFNISLSNLQSPK